jgi:hypothetical protein
VVKREPNVVKNDFLAMFFGQVFDLINVLP